MDEEWRVSLIVHDQPTPVKPVSAGAVRDLLRSRVGEEISVTAGKAGIFLYAATGDAAGTAERTAREVLAQQGLAADVRLEWWDPSRGAWLDVRPGDAATAELPSGHERNPGRRRLRSAGALIEAIIESIDNWP
jgi:hypothetical protein